MSLQPLSTVHFALLAHIGGDQIGEAIAPGLVKHRERWGWAIKDLEERGLIEQIPLAIDFEYVITDAGRKLIGIPI
jgi:hypothetical protein